MWTVAGCAEMLESACPTTSLIHRFPSACMKAIKGLLTS